MRLRGQRVAQKDDKIECIGRDQCTDLLVSPKGPD